MSDKSRDAKMKKNNQKIAREDNVFKQNLEYIADIGIRVGQKISFDHKKLSEEDKIKILDVSYTHARIEIEGIEDDPTYRREIYKAIREKRKNGF